MLRKLNRLDEALEWYSLCLVINPTDAGLHANIGFTLHLSGRFNEAISEYHHSLALQHSPFCADMLTRAMKDVVAHGSTEDLLGFDTGSREGEGEGAGASHLDFIDAMQAEDDAF